MPTMKKYQKYLRADKYFQDRLESEVVESAALFKALNFSGLSAIDHPAIELIDIFCTLKDPLQRLQALVALEKGEFSIRPCILMPLYDNLKLARAVARVFKKEDRQ